MDNNVNNQIPDSDESQKMIPVDSVINVSISQDKMMAFIEFEAPANGGKAPTYNEIIEKLNQAGVVFGIMPDAINRLIDNPRFNRLEKVAEGESPKFGVNSRINFLFSTSTERKPLEREDGTVDFRELGIVKNVTAGEPLCQRIPATPGFPGHNVLGEETPTMPGINLPLPLGSNTVASEDDNQVLAAIDGQVDLVKGIINVLNVLKIKNDVDHSTGNIDFVGNIDIGGNVHPGFSVKAGGNVNIRGCLDGGEVIAGGNVVVGEGFNGMNTGKIEANGDIKCKYIQNGIVTSKCNVDTSTCINSRIMAGDTAKVHGLKSKIVASHIIARNGIECVSVGSENATRPNILEVGFDPVMLKRLNDIPDEIEACQKNITAIDRMIVYYKQLMDLNKLSNEKRLELIKSIETRNAAQTKIEELEAEKTAIQQEMLSTGYGDIKITGTAQPGTVIVIGNEKRNLTATYRYMKFVRTEGEIVATPIR